MGIFGWSLPPGCGTLPGEEPEEPCLICGLDVDHCICPECQICGTYGDPRCYIEHGLRRTEEQKFSLECMNREWEEENKSWNDYYKSYLDDSIFDERR